jgi:hypothetical protein
MSTFNMPTNYQNNSNVEPPPSFLKAQILISENVGDNEDTTAALQGSNEDPLDFYKQQS